MEHIKILKTLGSGMFGTTYRVRNEIDNKIYALKRQKILKSYIEKSTKYYMWREIYFYSWINNHIIKSDQKFFMKMIDYKFYSNCDYLNDKYFKEDFINNKLIKKMIKSKHCLDLLVDLKDGTINQLTQSTQSTQSIKTKLNSKQLYSMIIQCSYICYLMNKSGYSHNDLHYGNIAYTKVDKDSLIKIVIDNKQYLFKSYGYQFSVIDYGLILHKKFILTKKEKNTYQNNMIYNKDMKSFYIFCLTNIKEFTKKKYKKEKKILLDRLYEEKPELYIRIKQLILSFYPNMIKYYDDYEIDRLSDDIHINKLLFNEIMQYLAIYDINLISKCFNKKILPNNISNQDLEFFKLNINNHISIIKYFMNKLI